jgi:predicted metal-dependent hydrolase
VQAPHNDSELTLGELLKGLDCFDSSAFFEAQEHRESAWLTALEPEKTSLQGLIQVAVSFHHLQRGNQVRAVSLRRSALRRWKRYTENFGGITIAPLRISTYQWLQSLDVVPQSPPPPIPRLALIRGGSPSGSSG